jgi:hypothetical protein
MRWIETHLGRLPIWGDPGDSGPVVFVVRGALPPIDQFSELQSLCRNVVLVHLPGFHSPVVRPISVQTFAEHYDAAIGSIFPNREIHLIGISTGSLVVQAMNTPNSTAAILVEPFLTTAKLWPLIEIVRRELRESQQPLLHTWLHAVLGYRLNEIEERDYRHLAAIKRPTLAVVGDIKLMPQRRLLGLPSLSDDEDRAKFRHRVVKGGHAIPASFVAGALHELLSNPTGDDES